MCQLWGLKVYDSKKDTTDDNNSQQGDETKCVNCGVIVLCRDWRQNNKILVLLDITSENVLLQDINISGGMKEGEGKQKRTFTRLLYSITAWILQRDIIYDMCTPLDELSTQRILASVHMWSGGLYST